MKKVKKQKLLLSWIERTVENTLNALVQCIVLNVVIMTSCNK